MPKGSETPGAPLPSLPPRSASPLDPEQSSVGALAVVVIFAIFGGMMLLALWLAIPWGDLGVTGAGPATNDASSQPQLVAPPPVGPQSR
jgi:hypothetical protein